MHLPALIIPVVSLVSLASAGVGCSGINPVRQQQTDALIAEYTAKPKATHAPAVEPRLKAWEVGQWAVYVREASSGPPLWQRRAIVARDEAGWWLEEESYNYYLHIISKRLYAEPNVRAPHLAEIIKVGDRAPLVACDSRKGRPCQSATGLEMLPDRETTTVIAGTFPNCFLGKFPYNDFIGTNPVISYAREWLHPDVPISGVVKLDADHGAEELAAYGDSGAVSAIPALP